MKPLFAFLLMIACSSFATAAARPESGAKDPAPASADVIKLEGTAVLHFCSENTRDCGGARIEIDDTFYPAAGATAAIHEKLENVIGTYGFHHLSESQPFYVSGYVKKVVSHNGWGPRNVTVFFITDGLDTLRLPK